MSRRARNKTVSQDGCTAGIIRCAIYTRKSSDEGLDQEFNSLDAQRESAESFIASQKAEGWTTLTTRYDDGGYSGGSMERPALERLLRGYSGQPPISKVVRALFTGCAIWTCRQHNAPVE